MALNVKSIINKTTGVSRTTTRAIRTKNAKKAARRVSRGGAGG